MTFYVDSDIIYNVVIVCFNLYITQNYCVKITGENKMNDLVSIITPSYNTAKYIAKTVESVQAQTYTNWEMIIIDDCSTDNTDDVIKPFLEDKRIKYLKNDQNSGAAISRNYALREAKGKWIAFLDSDDLWLPEKLEKQLNFMKSNGYYFSYTRYEEIDENANPLNKIITGPKKITKHGMYNYCWVGCLTVMYDAEKIGLIQIEKMKNNNDYAMWLQACKKADCYLLDENLAKYRRGRTGSISTQSYTKLIKWHYKLYRLCDKKGPVASTVLTLRNLFFGIIKKILYVKSN